jgi:phosphatidylinositol dimannoside acyltransferase
VGLVARRHRTLTVDRDHRARPATVTIPGVGEDLAGRLYGFAWRVTPRLPGPVAALVFGSVAAAMRWSGAGGVRQLRINLAQVLGQAPDSPAVADAAARGVHSYLRYWREFFGLTGWSRDRIRRAVVFESLDRVATTRAAGRGVVLALPHSGNWDMAGVWLVQNHGVFTTVAERLRPESLFNRFVAYRESLGFEVIPLSGGERPPYQLLRDRLLDNRIVCLMAERDLSRNGVPVQFFGEPTRMPAGSAKLAIETGADLLPVHCWFSRDGWGMKVFPRLDTSSGDVTTVTQALADRFAANIAEHPQDWHMFQPQWLGDLSEARRARITGVGN